MTDCASHDLKMCLLEPVNLICTELSLFFAKHSLFPCDEQIFYDEIKVKKPMLQNTHWFVGMQMFDTTHNTSRYLDQFCL